MTFQLSPLNYSYDALEPYIDAETMRLHHDVHHRNYIDALNKAVAKHPRLENKPIESLLEKLDDVPGEIRAAVRDSGGGHANHELFWKTIGPPKGAKPEGLLGAAIKSDFGAFGTFQEKFTAAALKVFGSGWAFLALDPSSQKLEILSLPDQDSPLLGGKPVLLCCDVWEHSYYLKYQNRRAEYLTSWWNIVQWDAVNLRLESFRRDAVPAQGGSE